MVRKSFSRCAVCPQRKPNVKWYLGRIDLFSGNPRVTDYHCKFAKDSKFIFERAEQITLWLPSASCSHFNRLFDITARVDQLCDSSELLILRRAISRQSHWTVCASDAHQRIFYIPHHAWQLAKSKFSVITNWFVSLPASLWLSQKLHLWNRSEFLSRIKKNAKVDEEHTGYDASCANLWKARFDRFTNYCI